MPHRMAVSRLSLGGTVLLAVVVLLALSAPALAFPDVPAGHAYEEAINGLSSFGIIGGYPNGNFGLNDPVKRAQFAKMIVLTLEISPNTSTATRFTDLGTPDANGYPHIYVQTAYDVGITTGTNAAQTLFAPWNSIRRDQVVSMIVRGLTRLYPNILDTPPAGTASLFDGVGEPHGSNLRIAEYNGLLDGLLGMGPGWSVTATATRGEVAQVLWNVINGAAPTEVWVYADGSGDYPTIEAAVAGIDPGSTIYLGPGDFTLSDTLEVDFSFELAGSGMQGPDTTNVFGPSTVVHVGSCDFSASDICFLGTGTGAATNIMVADDATVDLVRCVFAGGVTWNGYQGSGLSLLGATTATVSDCMFISNDRHGIEVTDDSELSLENSFMTGNGQNGVMFADNATGFVTLSDCSGNDLYGISVVGSADVTLVSNTCSNCGADGIFFGGDATGSAVGNTCIANTHDGIACRGHADVLLDGNTCQHNKDNGITFGDDATGAIRANDCSYSEGSNGIDLFGYAEAVVEDNVCMSNRVAGIAFDGHSTGSVAGNECAGNQYGLWVGPDATPTVGINNLHDNTFNSVIHS